MGNTTQPCARGNSEAAQDISTHALTLKLTLTITLTLTHVVLLGGFRSLWRRESVLRVIVRQHLRMLEALEEEVRRHLQRARASAAERSQAVRAQLNVQAFCLKNVCSQLFWHHWTEETGNPT